MAFDHEIRVAWGDCDPARIVYTARLPWFALDAINAWWEHHGGADWYEMEIDRNIGTPFVRMEMDFCAPVTPRHRLVCRVWPNRLGETSVSFRVKGYQDGRICFSGAFVCVFVTADVFRKTAPPPSIREIVETHLLPDG